MFKLMGKEINAILGAKFVLIWTYELHHQLDYGLMSYICYISFHYNTLLQMHISICLCINNGKYELNLLCRSSLSLIQVIAQLQ